LPTLTNYQQLTTTHPTLSPPSHITTMLSRSVASSLRSAVARPAVAGPSFRAAAVRMYSAEAEAKPQDESSKKIAELEAKIAEMTVRLACFGG
jgi:hypothetical protein